MTMTRPLVLNERFIGIVGAEVPISTFTDFFESINAPDGTQIALFNFEGVLIGSDPLAVNLIGSSFAASTVFAKALPERAGTYTGKNEINGEASIISFRATTARPLFLAVAMSKSWVLRAWSQDVRDYTVVFIGLVLPGRPPAKLPAQEKVLL